MRESSTSQGSSASSSSSAAAARPPVPPTSTADDEAFSSSSALLIALITWVIYWLFLRPRPVDDRAHPSTATATTTTATGSTTTQRAYRQPQQQQPQQQPTGGRMIRGGRTGRPNGTNPTNLTTSTSRPIRTSEAAMEVLLACPSLPPHVATTTTMTTTASSSSPNVTRSIHQQVGLGGSNIILDDSGLVAFSATKAATATTTTTMTTTPTESIQRSNAIAMVQKDRVKILSRLCSLPPSSSSSTTTTTTTPPPPKGSTLVLAISYGMLPVLLPESNIGHNSSTSSADTISRVLYSLATFYNVILIVAIPEEESDTHDKKRSYSPKRHEQVVSQLRSSSSSSSTIPFLSEDILPSHRILLSTTTKGRIALVRQLSKVAMVIDWDPIVQEQLTRFGYPVILLLDDWKKTFVF